jgi:xylulokinase
MRTLIIGIDSGTQSTKALVMDAQTGKVLASAAQAYGLMANLPPGAKEQHPHAWRDAAGSAMRQALRQARAVAAEVKAIGVSGQQHGFVPLDASGEVIRPAKLWCDTTTTEECGELTEKLGGPKATIKAIGNAMLPGYTAPKILWLKKHEPKHYQRLATVLLPHDYLNFWLTGERLMEYGDASGTALLDVRKRKWSLAAIEAIDSELAGKLPPLAGGDGADPGLEPGCAGECGRGRQHDGGHRHGQRAFGGGDGEFRDERDDLRVCGETGGGHGGGDRGVLRFDEPLAAVVMHHERDHGDGAGAGGERLDA